MSEWRLCVDFTQCTGRGLCAELLPERVTLDDWGFPIVDDTPVSGALLRHAKRAVSACPALALRLERVPGLAPRQQEPDTAPAAI